MSYVQFSVIVQHPLADVVTHLDRIEEALAWGPNGGMRFKAMSDRTYVTVFGAGGETTPEVLTTLIDSFVGADGARAGRGLAA